MFRTAVAPLRNGSFSVAGTWPDGALSPPLPTATATSPQDLRPARQRRVASGCSARSITSRGVVQLRFRRRCLTHGLVPSRTSSTSYLEIPGVKYVEPRCTSRHPALLYLGLPAAIDADILGIDLVRLPSDGRVPIFCRAIFAVLGHSVGLITVSNGQTVNCGRSVSPAFASSTPTGRSSTPGTAPASKRTFYVLQRHGLRAADQDRAPHRGHDARPRRPDQRRHRLHAPVTPRLPARQLHLFRAFVAGDLVARVSTLFDQATWTNVWSETVIGSPATGTYNDVLSPIEVTNVGALTERWAIPLHEHDRVRSDRRARRCDRHWQHVERPQPDQPRHRQPYFTLRAIGWGPAGAPTTSCASTPLAASSRCGSFVPCSKAPETVINDQASP